MQKKCFVNGVSMTTGRSRRNARHLFQKWAIVSKKSGMGGPISDGGGWERGERESFISPSDVSKLSSKEPCLREEGA